MTEALELTMDDIAIEHDMEVDTDTGQQITFVVEAWFDVDRKFGLHINDEDDTWLNIYGKYNPYDDTLFFECEISRDSGSEYFDYLPTASEKAMFIDALTERIRHDYLQTPMEFCESICAEDEGMGGIVQ